MPNFPRPRAHAAGSRPAPWTARRGNVAPPPRLPLRRYEALALLADGELGEIVQRAPVHPVFESAFAALARGTIMATSEGPVAIEDLLPGMQIETRDAGFQPLLWIGSMTLDAPNANSAAGSRLFRIPVDSFGPSRPMPDLLLAPYARLLHRAPGLRDRVGNDEALTPVQAFEDGHTVIRVRPVSAVTAYHLAFRDHQILRANGLEIESFHPGTDLAARIDGEYLRQFVSFFPHIRATADFGPLRVEHLGVRAYADLSAA